MNITSNDSKIIQYKYAIVKITRFTAFLKRHLSPPDDTKDLSFILCHYLPLLAGNIFAINDSVFNGKLDLVSQYKLFKPGPISISSSITHIPYDVSDNVVNPLVELPSHQLSYKCVRQLLTLYEGCVAGYEKKLNQALAVPTSYGIDTKTIDVLLEEVLNDDLDLNGALDFELSLVYDNNDDQMVFKEATLIDFDLKMGFMLINHYTATLNHLKTVIEPFKVLKTQPKNRQVQYLSTIPNYTVVLHKLLLITIRLNDIYTIIRKLGRKIYLSNYNHLMDLKFLTNSSNSTYFKHHLLTAMDDLFNSTKKNGVLIATLTRFIRANSNFEVTMKNVLDFSHFVNQGAMLLDTVLGKLSEFSNLWIVNELKFRKSYKLPTQLLTKIYDEYVVKPKPANVSVHDKFPQVDDSSIDNGLSKLDINETPKLVLGSRSSSVSSNSSASNNRKPMQRPTSMIFLTAPNVRSGARQRSNSDTKDNTSRTSSLNSVHSTSSASKTAGNGAAAGAAAALKSNLGLGRLSTPNRTNMSPPKASIRIDKTLVEPKHDKMSANQRLQMHLRQAAKAGSLMTHEKEVLTPVTFDPNSPSSVHIRRYVEGSSSQLASSNVSGPTTSTNNGQTAPLRRKARDQVTKLNTKRNEILSCEETDSDRSLMSPMSEAQNDDSISDTSKPKVRSRSVSAALTSEIPVKKVRFVGVPEYTAAEDAPTAYSSKILKNFAVFKSPSVGFKRKDQMLKKEESLLFKSQVQQTKEPQTMLSNLQTKMKIKTRLT